MKLKFAHNVIFRTLFFMSMTNTALASTTSVWEVSNGTDKVYVGGTVHLLPITEFPLPEAFTTAYKNTDSVVLEAKLPNPADPNEQMKMIQALSYAPDENLSKKLSEETYAKLQHYFSSFGVPDTNYISFKPGLVASMMTILEAQRNNLAGEGVDSYFGKKAEQDNRPIEYLETIEFQLSIMASLGDGEEDHFINSNLESMSDFKITFEKILKAWRNGNEQEINNLVIQQIRDESPEMFNVVMTDRNRDWVSKIKNMFGDQDKEFVLVGVGHLIGKNSLLEMLEKEGYSITKL